MPRGAVGAGAVQFQGTALWFDRVEQITGQGRHMLDARDVPAQDLRPFTQPLPPTGGIDWTAPRIMGILNVTPDSFSDGGAFHAPVRAIAHAGAMRDAGADVLDVGGESTRPGADYVDIEEEISRTRPVISAIKTTAPISIDTRKAAVGRAGLQAGRRGLMMCLVVNLMTA